MYHVSGGDGLQVTEKNGWQKDAGEPAMSPDGRYLYYSKDVTPGQIFEYNKDPYGVIYAIIRRDLTTGKERTAVSEAGGSIAPRVSPDGKTLALVRRVGARRRLCCTTLATGEERAALRPARPRHAGGLGRSTASTRSTPGCPTASALVIWGEGRIWRVDAASGEGAGDSRSGDASSRPPPSAWSSRRSSRRHSFRYACSATSPWRLPTAAVVYSALGQVYARPLAEGHTQAADLRRRRSSSIRRGPPTASRLSTSTWTDADAGRVRVAPAHGGAGARRGGHARPLHRSVVLAGWLTGRLPRASAATASAATRFGEDPGIYVVKAVWQRPRHVSCARVAAIRSSTTQARASTSANAAPRSSCSPAST